MKSTDELYEELIAEKNRNISLLEFKVDIFTEKYRALETENAELKKANYDLQQDILALDKGPF